MMRPSKRLGALLLMFVMIFCIAGCGTSQENDTQEQPVQNDADTETNTDAKTETDTKAPQTAIRGGKGAVFLPGQTRVTLKR